MKKLFSLLLVAAMMLGLVPAMAESTDLTKVTIAFTTFYDVDNWLEYSNEVKLLREKYGIEIEAYQYDDEKMNLLLANGDLPDILCIWSKYYQTVRDNKLALDLTPYLENELSNFNRDEYKAAVKISKEAMGGEEQALYFLPNCIGIESANGMNNCLRGYAVRWDLYKQLGCPEINSDKDYADVLEQMVALEPVTENGDQVYAMACTDESMTWWNLRGGFVRDTAGVSFWSFVPYLYQESFDENELHNGYRETDHSAFWTDMKLYNDLYNRGLFDPDSFIMTRDEYNSKAKAGQYVAIGPSTAGDQYFNSLADESSMKGLVIVPSKNSVVYSNAVAPFGYLSQQALIVNAKSDNIEAALKLLNITRDPEFIMTTYNGIQGEDWDYDENGKAYYTEKYYADKAQYTGDDYKKETGIFGNISEFSAVQPTLTAPYGGYYQISYNPENYADTEYDYQKDFAAYYGGETMADVYAKFVEEGNTIDCSARITDYALVMPAIPDDIKRILNDCNDLYYRAIPDLVMAETEEDFNAIQADLIAQLDELGEPEAWNWVKTEFDKAMEIVKPIYEEAAAALLK